MRDLFVTTHTPVLGTGQAVRTYGVARALATHRELDLLYVRFGETQPDAAFRAIPGITLHEVVPSRGLRRLLTYASARASGVPKGFARGISPELAREARRLAEVPDRGRVIADGPITAAALTPLARRRPVIYNAHNLESGFRADVSGASSTHAEALLSFERGLLARAAESWMVSEPDLQGAREVCAEATLRYVPNVVDVEAITPVSPYAGEPRGVFVASFTYLPNRNGLRFLLDEVMPLVWRQLPQAQLALVGGGLVGGGLRQPPSDDPRVQALGFVPDLRDAYANAACAVVPLLEGGGTPLKLIEALAYGLPVIATPRAAAGLQLRDGEHCLIAGDAHAFATALVRVLRDGAPEIARAGRELARERFSIEALSTLVAP